MIPTRIAGSCITSEIGIHLDRQNRMQRSFKPLLKKAGLPEVRFQDLWHPCTTILLKVGQHPKFVQEMLGQAIIAITLGT